MFKRESIIKTKQTIVCGVLAVILAFSFAACPEEKTESEDEGGTGTAPTITTTTLPNGTVGTAYSQTLAAAGDAPITWSIDTGSLPGGLTLSTEGVISGTPTTANTFNFTVKATNAAGSGTKVLSIGIDLDSPRTWTAVSNSTFGTSQILAIAYGIADASVGRFVAVGQAGKMAYSADGVNWTAVTDSTFGTSNIRGIAYGNNRFVAGGRDGKMAYSDDGKSWTAVSNSTFGDSGIWDIAYVNNRFVAGGDRGKMAYSADGVSWTVVADSTFPATYTRGETTYLHSIRAIAYGNNRFVAGGTQGTMAYSADGTSWTAVTNSTFGTSDNIILAIAYGNNKFVAVGQAGKMAYSNDSITWTAVTDSTFGMSNIIAIVYGNNRFVAGGRDGKMAYSTDGATWTAVSDSTFGNSDIWDIAYGNGRFVAGGNDGKMAYADW